MLVFGASGAQGKAVGPARIPDALVYLESEQQPAYAVLVEKRSQKIFLYAFDGTFRLFYQAACSTGEVSGPKMLSGDKRTPEGVYFFTKEHPKRDLSPIYGSRAFPIDYPNLLDRAAGRGGNAIWMHGTNKPLKPMDSNGCIVLRNQDIDKLAPYITLNRTPIIVVDRLSYSSANAMRRIRTSILSFMKKWEQALTSGTYHQYLSGYHPDYLPDISWWNDWNKIRAAAGEKGAGLTVMLKQRAIFGNGPIYTVLFDQVIQLSRTEAYAGTRKLFLLDENGTYRITGDAYQTAPSLPKQWAHASPLVAMGRNLAAEAQKTLAAQKIIRSKKKETATKALDDKREIVGMIDGWLKAWASMNIKNYGRYYAKDFRSQGGADRHAWLSYKNSLNKKYRFIKITRKDVVIKRSKKHVTVSFVQTYASDQYKAVGVKRLTLKREGKQWKIFRESWKRI